MCQRTVSEAVLAAVTLLCQLGCCFLLGRSNEGLAQLLGVDTCVNAE